MVDIVAEIYPDWGLFLNLPLSLEALTPHLPDGLTPWVGPDGLGSMGLNLVHFKAGGAGVHGIPETYEVDISVAVQVDNRAYDPSVAAAHAMHVINIAATSEAYLETCRAAGYRTQDTPGLRFELEDGAMAGRVVEDGGEILRFSWTDSRPAPSPFARLGQDAVHDHRGHYRLNYELSGLGWMDLPQEQSGLVLQAHPFFLDLPLDHGDPKPTRASALPWGEPARMRFFTPLAE